MIYKTTKFSYLLDNLRAIASEYHINDTGIVVNNQGEEVNDKNIVLSTEFCALYCIGYKNLAEEIDNYPIPVINEGVIQRALSDYDVFNSFIKDCIDEYNMYGSVGTGFILYSPYTALSKFFFGDINRNKILSIYVKEVLNEVKENKRVRN